MGTTKVKSHLPNHQAGIKYCRVFLVLFSAVYWASLCNASMHCWCVTSCCFAASQHTRNRQSHLAIAIRQFTGLTVAGWHILFFHRDWRAFIVCRPWDMTIAVAMLYVSLSIINPRLCPSNNQTTCICWAITSIIASLHTCQIVVLLFPQKYIYRINENKQFRTLSSVQDTVRPICSKA